MTLSHGRNEGLISYCLLAIALVTAAALVFPGMAASPLGIDEHVSYWILGPESPGTLWERSLNYAATPPLSSVLQRKSVELFGKTVFWMRLPSALSFLFSVVFTYCFARELLGLLPAGLAVQLLVWHPDLIDRMRQARPYALTVALAAALLWLSLRWCRTPGSFRLMYLWTIVATALIWTHYVSLPFVGLIVIWLIGFPRLMVDGQKRIGWRLAVALGFLALAVLPLAPSLLRLQEFAAVLNYGVARPPLWKGIGPYWWLTLPAGFCAGWLLTRVIGAKGISNPRHEFLAVLILLGFVPVVIFAVFPVDSLATLGEPRYRLVYAPASAVLLSSMLMQNRNWIVSLVATALGIAGAWGTMGEYPWISKELSVPAAADWTALTIQLQQQGQPGEPLFVLSGLVESRLVPGLYDDLLFNDYIACRAGRFIVETPHPRYALPWIWVESEQLFNHYASVLQKSGDRGPSTAWLIVGTDTDLGRTTIEQFKLFVSQLGYRETARTETSNASLIKFERPGTDIPN